MNLTPLCANVLLLWDKKIWHVLLGISAIVVECNIYTYMYMYSGVMQYRT